MWELSGFFVLLRFGVKARIPVLEGAEKLSMEDSCAYLEQQVCAAYVPGGRVYARLDAAATISLLMSS